MSRFVALGSSYAAGPGIAPVANARALRSGRNYAHQVAERLSLELIDVTCSGATTANILTRPQRTFAGVMRPQIEAVAADAGLVTITAGGNDIAYVGSLIKGSIANELARRLSTFPGPSNSTRWRTRSPMSRAGFARGRPKPGYCSSST
jgi:hypothetical protein